ncbi:MAG: hypothetical protein Q9160_005332 [Pyrenula sp. 1 TL-2023]
MASFTSAQPGNQAESGEGKGNGEPSYPTPNTPTVAYSRDDTASDTASQDNTATRSSSNPSFHDPPLFPPGPESPRNTPGANPDLTFTDGIKHSGRTPVEVAFHKYANANPCRAIRELLADRKRTRFAAHDKLSFAQFKAKFPGKAAPKASTMPKEKKASPKPAGPSSKPSLPSHPEPMTTRGTKRRRDEAGDSPDDASPAPSASPSILVTSASPPPASPPHPPSPAPAVLKAPASPAKRAKPMPPPASTQPLKRAVTPAPARARKPSRAPKKPTSSSGKPPRTTFERKSSKATPSAAQSAASSIKTALDTRFPPSFTDWTLPSGASVKSSRAACAPLFSDAWTPPLSTLDDPSAADMYAQLPIRRKDDSSSSPAKLPRNHFALQNDPCLGMVHEKEAQMAAAIGSRSLNEYLTQKRRLFLGYAELRRMGHADVQPTHAQAMASCDVNKVANMHRAFERWGWIKMIPGEVVARGLRSAAKEEEE